MAKAYPNSPDFAVLTPLLGTKPLLPGTNTWRSCIPLIPPKRLIYTNQQTVQEISMSNLKSFVLLAATAIASMGAVGAASAADTPNMQLQFKPEELTTEEGVQKVYRRIREAAENVCTGVTTGTHIASAREQSCRRDAVASAVQAIHNKRLAEVASASKFG
jgi:UrcA family protein